MKKALLIAAITLPLFMFAEAKEEKQIGYLGISFTELSHAMKTALDLEYGVLVDKVFEDSPAEAADIKTGDVILEIDGNKITEYKILKTIVAENPNNKVKIRINRSGRSITKGVTLDEKIWKKKKIKFEIDLPDKEYLKKILCKGSQELEEQMAKLKEELLILKKEIEELKKKIK